MGSSSFIAHQPPTPAYYEIIAGYFSRVGGVYQVWRKHRFQVFSCLILSLVEDSPKKLIQVIQAIPEHRSRTKKARNA